MTRKFQVPIYDATVWIVVLDEPGKSPLLDRVFDGYEGDFSGLCCWNGFDQFGLFFDEDSLTQNVMAHEVFHLTHRILERGSVRFDKDSHEAGAHLHGYLMNEVSKRLQPYMGKKK